MRGCPEIDGVEGRRRSGARGSATRSPTRPDCPTPSSALEDLGGGLRQSLLAESMGWHRSRMSHQLTRMPERGPLVRGTDTTRSGVLVETTGAGRAAISAARPVHAAAVRRHLLAKIPAKDRPRLLSALETLAEPAEPEVRKG
ncbi:MarR family winged helix-turn-helix transcriptional regulator [Amycolatopsis rubida]|nr:MarR family winged helix-turn-helix transcriptional regulator [Amycolatopsis rubida]